MSLKRNCMPFTNIFRYFSKSASWNSNYYKSLGLTPSASPADIKAAYYRLSKIHHPDRNNGSEASAKIFREITTAYEVLGKSESRRNYDREKLRIFESRKPNNGTRSRINKRNRSAAGFVYKGNRAQDLRRKVKPSNPYKCTHQMNAKDVEVLLTASLRIMLFTIWRNGNR